MKTRTLYRLSGLLVIPLFYFLIFAGYKAGNTTERINTSANTETQITPSPGGDKNFVNFILNNDYTDVPTPMWVEQQLGNYRNTLKFNGIQIYDRIFDIYYGTERFGTFDQDISAFQRTQIQNLTGDISSESLQLYWERVKISRLCYAQRIVYEVSQNNNTTNYGFCYQNCNGQYITDSGRTVIYTGLPSNSNQGYIAENIYENMQHGDLATWNVQQADADIWHMKPMMRIPANTNDDAEVVRIDVINFRGETLKQVTLRGMNFKVGGIYNGQYTEKYNFEQNIDSLAVSGDTTSAPHTLTGLSNGMSAVDWQDWDDNCQVDFKIWWFGTVDVWFDKMTVDDRDANQLFQGLHDPKIVDELTNTSGRNFTYFVDEMLPSQILCVKYVDSVMKAINPNVKLNCAITNFLNIKSLKQDDLCYRMFLENLDIASFSNDAHEFHWGCIPDVFTAQQLDDRIPDYWWVKPVSEYNDKLQFRSLGDKNAVTPEDEFFSVPVWWESLNPPPQGSLIYQITKAREQSKLYAPEMKYIMQPQIQAFTNVTNGIFGNKEPTNEEIQVQAMVSLAHGADGLCWFIHQSHRWYYNNPYPNRNYIEDNPASDYFVQIGMFNDNDGQPRHNNMYDQDKWDYVSKMNDKLLKWKPTLDNITWSSGWSVHSEGSNHEFIENFVSIVPHLSGQNNCVTDGPGLGEFADCPDESFWEMGFFGAPASERNTKYFMLVNRRCVPENDSHFTPDNRFVKIKFNAASLPGSWKSWQISEVGGNTSPINFNKNSGYINLGTTAGSMGWFKPGEGKMFKITPTTQTGGDLVCDEVITGETFTCEDTIFSNGYNITIGAGTNMKFTDSSCIVMNGGVFTMGDQQVSGSQNITFDALSGNAWRGHSFTGTEVHIYGASFTGLANDSVYALNLIDCPVVDIRNTTFNTTGSLKGGINAVYYANEESATVNFYTGGNTFTATGSTIPTINVSSFAGVTTPLIIENNTFTNGNTAIFLSGVIGGAIKNNNISENYTGISLLSSYIDVSGNTISSTVNGSTGIFAAGGSEIKMNSAGSKELGGINNISNEGTGTNNIKVEGSYFLTDEGQNIFNISDISTSNHLYGYFPQFISIPYDETMNCFKISGSPTNTPYNLVTDGYQGSQISFNFNPLLSGCDPEQGDNMMVLDLGNGINDTIYSNGSGSGGSESSIENKNQKQVYVQNVNTAYDSICMLMRSRNYSAARTKCLEMISNYPDSIQSLNAIAKLYLASVSSNSIISDLRVFYENLILNHPNNTSLVKRANYYILKCKVRLHEYTSALAGFQQIINENPYSYEGLIARWDYMATSLLVPGGGGESMNADFGFSIADLKAEDLEAEDREGNPKSEFRDPNSSDDKSPFTKEERVNIRKSINTAIENDKNDNDRKIRVLETKSDQGDVNAIKELAQVKALKQVVKIEKPRSITEHIKLVSEDIQKVFGSVTGGKGKDMSNIPTVYRLSQNYPNPFNPVTKINYDLPKDAMVNIVIYDILGREVKRLVNNELKTAGTNIIDFNAANYASGVYFYRIEAEEPGGNKFVDSKKMVLLK